MKRIITVIASLTLLLSLLPSLSSPVALADNDGFEISGEIFADNNGDGYDNGKDKEIKKTAFTVRLFKQNSAGKYVKYRQQTVRDGEYEFDDLPAGNYKVYVKYPNSNKYKTVTKKLSSKKGEWEERNGFKKHNKNWVVSNIVKFTRKSKTDDISIDCGFKVKK